MKKVMMMCVACLTWIGAVADDYETIHTEKIQNPMLWADVPDPDVIRVGDTWVISSTD